MRRLLITVASALLVLSIIAAVGIGLLKIYADKNIDYNMDERLFEYAKGSSTATFLAYDSSGELVEYYKGNLGVEKTWYSMKEIPESIKLAFLAIEDRHFYSHSGVDVKRTVAAFLNALTGKKPIFGASTITQQVIKNISGDDEQTFRRKLNEILRALHLEMTYTKDEIFEMYLNIVPMTGTIYGVGEASYKYFGKEPQYLTLAESATIAGITNSPVKYNPYTNSTNCLQRRNLILERMLSEGFISYDEYNDAIRKDLGLVGEESGVNAASWFVETAIEEIIRDIREQYNTTDQAARLMLYSGTETILTVNLKIQEILESYFEQISGESLGEYSFVVNDPNTNDLLAIVGQAGRKTGNRLLNNALSLHSPASSIKPLSLYASAVDRGIANWSTIIDDSPLYYVENSEERVGYPKNSPDIYEGPITLSDALCKSKNTVAVKLYNTLGGEYIYNQLYNQYGFKTLVDGVKIDGKTYSDKGPASIALGQMTYGVSLRDLTSAYSVFPNDGVLRTSSSYYEVRDRSGNSILSKPKSEKRIINKDTARILTQMLAGVVSDGTARGISLKYSVDVAGKTGTSSGGNDRWFVGFTPYYLAGAWVGSGANDSRAHLEIWDKVMTSIHELEVFRSEDELLREFKTEGLIRLEYCTKTGCLAGTSCIESGVTAFGWYSHNNAPKEICDISH